MVFSWFRDQHRSSIAAQPFPDEWFAFLTKNVAHYPHLTDEEQRQLHQDIQIFIAEKYWEGVSGLELTDEMQVTIAGPGMHIDAASGTRLLP